MFGTLTLWFSMTLFLLTGARCAASYFVQRYRSETKVQEKPSLSNATLVIAAVVGNSFIALALTAGPTFGSTDENWFCHGVPYYQLLIAATLGGAIGGYFLYLWEQHLRSRI